MITWQDGERQKQNGGKVEDLWAINTFFKASFETMKVKMDCLEKKTNTLTHKTIGREVILLKWRKRSSIYDLLLTKDTSELVKKIGALIEVDINDTGISITAVHENKIDEFPTAVSCKEMSFWSQSGFSHCSQQWRYTKTKLTNSRNNWTNRFLVSSLLRRLRRTVTFSRLLGNTRKQHPANHCLQETNTHWQRSSGWLESWEGLLLVTDVSTTCSEAIFRVKW